MTPVMITVSTLPCRAVPCRAVPCAPVMANMCVRARLPLCNWWMEVMLVRTFVLWPWRTRLCIVQ